MYGQTTPFQFAGFISILLIVIAIVSLTIGVVVQKKSRIAGLVFMTVGFFVLAMIAFVFYTAANS